MQLTVRGYRLNVSRARLMLTTVTGLKTGRSRMYTTVSACKCTIENISVSSYDEAAEGNPPYA